MPHLNNRGVAGKGLSLVASYRFASQLRSLDLRSITNPWQLPYQEGLPRDGRLPRKEVIQPQLPLRLPCYDFVPVTGPTLGGCPLTVGAPTSGVTSSHDVTGGVYKARERIHRTMADARLLATPPSCSRVADCNLN